MYKCKINPKTFITFNNCMKSSGYLNLVPKHIVTSLYDSPCLIVDFHIQFSVYRS